MKIAIGLPHISEMYHTRFGDSLLALVARTLREYPKAEIIHISTYRENPTFARNKIANKALELKCDYLFFLDDDMIFNEDVLVNLIKQDKDIVGALTFIRSEPHEPSFYTQNSDGETYNPVLLWNPNELIKCDAIGMAATLIKTPILEKMKEKSHFYKDMFGFFEGYAEDLNFCKKAVNLGFSVYCDTSLVVGHLTSKIIGYGDYKALAEEKYYSLKKYQSEKQYGKI